jgi:hypothetical protein
MAILKRPQPKAGKAYNYLEIEIVNSKSVVRLLHDAGFFSNCTVLLFGILQSKYVSRIDSANSFQLYQNEKSNIFNNVFVEAVNIDNRKQKIFWRKLNFHAYYRDLPLKKLGFYLNNYFQTSEKIQTEVERLLIQYNIDPRRSVGLYYRGTDKEQELNLPDIDLMISDILKLNPMSFDQIVLQTDDFRIQQRAKELLGDRVVLLEHLDTRGATVGQHFLPNNRDHIFQLIPAMKIIARCKYVYVNTSNVSLWIALFRGNHFGFNQYPKPGLLHRLKNRITNRFSTEVVNRMSIKRP